MSWKDVPKLSYSSYIAKFTIPSYPKVIIEKFAEWEPSHPFIIPYQGPKIRYSEGDEITSVADPVFNVEFTGVPLSGQHFPCGYWHKNYIPPQVVIYTSLLYPVEVYDGMGFGVAAIEGTFRSIIQSYDYGYESASFEVSMIAGTFRSQINYYTIPPESINYSLNIISGVFRDVIWNYVVSPESTSYNVSAISGTFRDVMITYDLWPAESTTFNVTLISGYHNA